MRLNITRQRDNQRANPIKESNRICVRMCMSGMYLHPRSQVISFYILLSGMAIRQKNRRILYRNLASRIRIPRILDSNSNFYRYNINI